MMEEPQKINLKEILENMNSCESFKKGFICKVKKSYEAKDNEELTVEEGDFVKVLETLDESWIKVTKYFIPNSQQHCPNNIHPNIHQGIVHMNYLEILFEISPQLNGTVGHIVKITKREDSLFEVEPVLYKQIEKRTLRIEDLLNQSIKPYCYREPQVLSSPSFNFYDIKKIFGVIFAVFAVLIALANLFIFSKTPIKEDLSSKLTKLLEDNPVLSSSMDTLLYCLEETVADKKPCIILLLNYDEVRYSNLLSRIGLLGVQELNNQNKNTDAEIINLSGSYLSKYPNDNGFFKEHKDKLEKMKVMLVDEMEKIPGYIMEKFHSLCDAYNPAVRQAIIIFLLNFNPAEFNLGDNDATLANNILSKIWKGSIKDDLINPLITRVSENVIRLEV